MVSLTIAWICLICTLVAPTVRTEPQIKSFNPFPGEIVPGSDVEVTCVISDLTPDYHTAFYKEGIDLSTRTISWFPLSTGVKPTYPSLPFAFDSSLSGQDTLYVMKIKQIEANMTGNYSCVVQSESTHMNRTMELNVIREPISMKLLVDGNVIYPDSLFTSNLSMTHKLECIAEGANPGVNIRIEHGNQDLTPQITSLEVSRPLYPFQPGQYNFLIPTARNTRAVISDWKLDVTYHGEPLRCMGRLSENYVWKTVKFTPVANEGPPSFVCNDTLILPPSAEDGFEFSCIVMSQPALINTSFQCIKPHCRQFNGFPINEWHPATDVVFSVYVTNEDPAPKDDKVIKKARMTMKARLPREDLIGRTYAFIAANDRGQTVHEVELVGTASRLLSGPVFSLTLLSILLISLLSHSL